MQLNLVNVTSFYAYEIRRIVGAIILKSFISWQNNKYLGINYKFNVSKNGMLNYL